MSQIFAPNILKNETVIVTGGGSGIGERIAEELGSLGAKIAIGSRKPERIAAATERLRERGVDAVGATLDIRNEESIEAFLAFVASKMGPTSILINNAGGQFPSPAEGISPKGWRAVIDTNLNGTWLMTQAVAKGMLKRKQGKIINIVANMWRGFPGMVHTGAARAGVVNMTKTLSLEWAKSGLRVNAIAPGVIRSSGLETYPEAVRAAIETEVPKQIPLKTLGDMNDVAWAVAFLASPAGNYVTGETFRVDGGQSLWGMSFPV